MTTNENLRLTYNEFKQIGECEKIKEEQVLKIIDTMFQMSIFVFNAFNKEKKNICYG
jgi:hypothetical protein